MTVERTCVACRQKNNKENLVKVVYNKNGNISIDKNKNMEGRGAYICNNIECARKCLKNRAFNKSFKTAVPQEFYEELIQNFGA